MKSFMDTEPGVVMRSSEVGLKDRVFQVRVGSESGTNEVLRAKRMVTMTILGQMKQCLSIVRSVCVLGEKLLMNRLQSCLISRALY